MGSGREGDWDCGACQNRNYAFRSLCNRCKQPRLLVDTKTPADSTWLPRIGDWICSGCSNNNYASRDKCKKCGDPKEEAQAPIVSSLPPPYAHYFARAQSHPDTYFAGHGPDKYGFHSYPSWPGYSHPAYTPAHTRVVPEGWRNGDWLCKCGFHNYSSRSECKECNAPQPSGVSPAVVSSAASDIYPALGTKRLAPDEFVNDWDNKRLNAGYLNHRFLANHQELSFQGFDQLAGSSNSLAHGMHAKYPMGNSETAKSLQGQLAAMPVLIGKGAKQWRDGDWMCSHCDNHNFASRSDCNRCKTPKEPAAQPGSST